MQAFKYKGYGPDGDKVQGEIVAGNIEEAERRVTAQDVTIIAIIPAGRKLSGGGGGEGDGASPRGKTLSDAEAADILHNLSIMAETGVPFVEALEAVAASAKSKKTAEKLVMLKNEVVNGRSLSQSMKGVGNLFPPLVADMVRVAEEGGRLDRALKTAATYLERSADLRKRILNAMLYPCVMLSISLLTVLVLVVVVMPRFAMIFERMDADVPAFTKFMLNSGTVLRENPWGSLITLLGLGFGVRFALKQPVVSTWAMKLLLKMPFIGDLLRKLAYSRAFHSVATLLAGNVSIISALENGAKVSGNVEVREALLNARVAVEHGRTLSDALAETGVFPPTLIQMVNVGERTGRLSSLLATMAESLEKDVDAKLKALVGIIEPVMIVVMGLIVGAITLSVIGPIYSVVQNIH